MRILVLLCISLCTISLTAQEASMSVKESGKFISQLNKLSITATAGTSSFSTAELKSLSLNQLSQVSLGQLTISYKMNPRLSFGISTMGNLASSKAGYYNAENQFFSFCEDDDDDDEYDDDDLDELDDDDDDLYELDDDDDDLEEDHDEDCDEDEIGQNLVGTVTYKLSEKLPFFVQAGAGYTFAGKAPSFTTMIGYNQKIMAGVGIMAGIRYSNVIQQNPADAIRTISGAGLKAEVGLSWNF